MAMLADIGRHTTAPSLDEIEAIAREAYAMIPAELRRHVRDVAIRVVEFPDEETEQEMSILDTPQDLDMIFLYRRPLLDYWCESGEDLSHLIRHVLIHEIGHHFGFSDDDMERLELEA